MRGLLSEGFVAVLMFVRYFIKNAFILNINSKALISEIFASGGLDVRKIFQVQYCSEMNSYTFLKLSFSKFSPPAVLM